MTTVLFALGAALAYGLSDFLGGVISRRTSVWPVALMACAGAGLGTLVLALAVPGNPTGADLAWGLLAGVGSGVGTAFLYRGFARGRMGVVAPVSAVGAALLPPASRSPPASGPARSCGWAGRRHARHLAGLPRATGRSTRTPATSEGFLDGILAGAGFGLLFAALGQVPEGAGYWPVMGTQVVSLLAVVVAALLLGGDPVPRRHRSGGDWGPACSPRCRGRLPAGPPAGPAQRGRRATSLYPAFTVLLATLLLGERLHRAQSVGLALCVVSVACVAAG